MSTEVTESSSIEKSIPVTCFTGFLVSSQPFAHVHLPISGVTDSSLPMLTGCCQSIICAIRSVPELMEMRLCRERPQPFWACLESYRRTIEWYCLRTNMATLSESFRSHASVIPAETDPGSISRVDSLIAKESNIAGVSEILNGCL